MPVHCTLCSLLLYLRIKLAYVHAHWLVYWWIIIQIYFKLEMYIGQDSGWIYGVNQETDRMNVQLYKKLTKMILKSTKCSSAMQSKLIKIHCKWAKGRDALRKQLKSNAIYTDNPKLHTSYIHQSLFIFRQIEKYDSCSFRWWKWSSDIHEYIFTLCIFVWANSHHKFNISSPNLLISSVFQLVSDVYQYYSQS